MVSALVVKVRLFLEDYTLIPLLEPHIKQYAKKKKNPHNYIKSRSSNVIKGKIISNFKGIMKSGWTAWSTYRERTESTPLPSESL